MALRRNGPGADGAGDGSILAAVLTSLLIGVISLKLVALPFWAASVLALAGGAITLIALLNLCEKTNAFWLARLLSVSMRYAKEIAANR